MVALMQNVPIVNWQPRNDYVMVKVVKAGQTPSGIAVPDMAAEGLSWYVHRVGPKITDLKPGDRVEIAGEIGQDIARVPNNTGLFITKEANVLLVCPKGE